MNQLHDLIAYVFATLTQCFLFFFPSFSTLDSLSWQIRQTWYLFILFGRHFCQRAFTKLTTSLATATT